MAVQPRVRTRFALIGGVRREAAPGLVGECQLCGRAMVAKCGSVKVWHWAHAASDACDPWWRGETAWHREWKSHFPQDWTEVVHVADNGERHFADVKTPTGWVCEFQNSPIALGERNARNACYQRVIWVVNGLRRKNDWRQFKESMSRSARLHGVAGASMHTTTDCRILREWASDFVPVFFDFGEADRLWWQFAARPSGYSYIREYSRSQFIETRLADDVKASLEFEKLAASLRGAVESKEWQLANPIPTPDPLMATLYRSRGFLRTR